MNNVEQLTTERIKDIMTEMNKWAHNCKALREQMENATGETRLAYSAVYNDYLWKLKLTTQRLWFYLAGCDELNPFVPLVVPEPSSSQPAPLPLSSPPSPSASDD